MNNKPFLLVPAAKDYLWGGSRLNDEFNKNINSVPLAETWECSTHPDGPSVLVTGERLSDLLKDHPQWLGTHSLATTGGRAELPILIKLIDAREDLSVQVHPDDAYALVNEKQWGKTEMWYVLDARKDARAVYGFNRNTSKEEVREAIKEGCIESLLNYVSVHKNDLFYIETGTVHAIGAGCLVVEIQESSNVTYRLYDYGRVGRDGQKRMLHVDKALDVASLKGSSMPRQPLRVLRYRGGAAYELLARCRYFQVERMLLNTEGRELPSFQTGSNSFHALLVVEGCGVLFGENFNLNFFKGDCIFVPAESMPLQLHGQAQLLDVSC